MSYRVTNSMMQSLLLNDMHANLSKLLDVQQQLSTQRKYQSASDNPNAVTKGMGLETMMLEGEQYIRNLQDAISWLKFSDSALNDINNIFQRMRELAIYAGDGSLKNVDRAAIAEELIQLREELRTYANSTIAGEYLFSGLKTDTAPFTIGPDGEIVYNGNNYNVNWEFSRNATGKVSVNGRELFPQNETTHSLKGIEVPLDFEWTGRNEILEFKVGWQTVKVRIPERWTDEIKDGVDNATDYNRYRDPGEELEGYSLKEIADLINNSTEMGDVSKLLKASVVTDTTRNIQYLVVKSHTGESVQLTSWPETDPVDIAQGIKGAAYGPAGRTAGSDGTVTFRFDDKTVFTVDVAAGDTMEDIAKKIGELPEGRVWSAYKTDGANSWIDIVSRKAGDYFNIETTGGATQLFAPQQVSVSSSKQQGNYVLSSNDFAANGDFTTLSNGTLTINYSGQTYEIQVPSGRDLDDIAAAINTALTAAGVTALTATAANGVLTLGAGTTEEFDITATGGLVPLFSDGVSVSSGRTVDSSGKYTLSTTPIPDGAAIDGDSQLCFEYNGKKYLVNLNAGDDMDTVAATLQAALQVHDASATVEVVDSLDADGNKVQSLSIKTDRATTLSGFGGAASVIGAYTVGSEDIHTNTDHTHIGFAAMMGMETAVKSTELATDAVLGDTTNSPLHIKFVSGKHSGEIYIEDNASLSLEDLAKRINSVCGDWLQAVVETDQPDGTDPMGDPLANSGDNREAATQRLVLRTIDGEPFAIYDGPGKDAANPAGSYAQMLGINTALMGQSPAANVTYPAAGPGSSFDSNMPAILEVTVGDKVFEVKVCENNCNTAEKVAAAIARQVNEQYGGTLLAWDSNDIKNNADASTFALYAVTGEPLRVIDKGYGDPRFSEYSGGIAMQLGIAAGITSTAVNDGDPLGPGTFRISTAGRSVDIPVLAGDTMQDIANRVRDYAGDWLDVSFYDNNIDTAGGQAQISFAAKDGSALTVFDVNGAVAWNLGLDTGLVGVADLSTFPTLGPDATLTISVNGASHTIDLVDNDATPPTQIVNSVEDLADLINTRFQGQDIHAEVISDGTTKRLVLSSPKGYTFEVSGTDGVPAAFGFDTAYGNTASKSHGGAGPFNQQVTSRTGNNEKKTDFFGVLDNLINCVNGGNVDGISDVMLGQLDNWMTTLLKCRAQVGALTSRYQTTETRLTQDNTGYTDLHTKTVGIDLAEALTDFQMASGVYEASLAAIARIMQPTLLDFLR